MMIWFYNYTLDDSIISFRNVDQQNLVTKVKSNCYKILLFQNINHDRSRHELNKTPPHEILERFCCHINMVRVKNQCKNVFH